jgi:hypothetical protein
MATWMSYGAIFVDRRLSCVFPVSETIKYSSIPLRILIAAGNVTVRLSLSI